MRMKGNCILYVPPDLHSSISEKRGRRKGNYKEVSLLGGGFLMTATLVISDIHPALRIVQEELMQGMVPNKPKVDIFMKRWFVFS